jgi:predicted oxidoreductase
LLPLRPGTKEFIQQGLASCGGSGSGRTEARSREFVTVRAGGVEQRRLRSRNRWTKLRCGKPPSIVGKGVEQVDGRVDDA